MKRTQSLEPQNVSENVWYYEEGRHFNFILRLGAFTGEGCAGTVSFKVPLRMLEASLKRSPKRGQS